MFYVLCSHPDLKSVEQKLGNLLVMSSLPRIRKLVQNINLKKLIQKNVAPDQFLLVIRDVARDRNLPVIRDGALDPSLPLLEDVVQFRRLRNAVPDRHKVPETNLEGIRHGQ